MLATPALADTYAEQKADVIKNTKLDTVPMGNNEFMMFNGTFAAYQYVYSIELIKIEGGTPHYEPLFMEEYDPKEKTVGLSDGTAFPAVSYHFDKASGVLDYTAKLEPEGAPLEYKYELKGDTFMLQEVLAPGENGGQPTVIFKALEKHAEKN